MRTLRHRVTPLLTLACVVALVPIASGAIPERPRTPLQIEPASTWVGLAKVHLELSELWLADDEVEGVYRIRVPLLPLKNDRGTIRLDAPTSLESLRASGGTLSGQAHSAEDDRTHEVVCKIERDGAVLITVTTDDRTLEFASRFVTTPAS